MTIRRALVFVPARDELVGAPFVFVIARPMLTGGSRQVTRRRPKLVRRRSMTTGRRRMTSFGQVMLSSDQQVDIPRQQDDSPGLIGDWTQSDGCRSEPRTFITGSGRF